MSTFKTILFEISGPVATITLNRPDKLNAFTDEMNAEMTKAFTLLSKQKEIRCLVMTGAGRAFCSGEDLSTIGESLNHGDILRKRYNPMIQKLASLPIPTIAAVNGVAAGAGMSLALACDFRLMHEKASLIQSFIHIGLVPDSGAFYYLPRMIGYAKALELAVLGEKVSAEDASRLGLATKVIAENEWQEEIMAFSQSLASKPTKAIHLIKTYMQKSFQHDIEAMLEKEAQAQRVAGLTKDHKEGVQAFIEKRKPTYQGY